MKVIEVEKCGIGECPWCVPDDTRANINRCGAYANHQPEISADLKTFPHLCPLTDAKTFCT